MLQAAPTTACWSPGPTTRRSLPFCASTWLPGEFCAGLGYNFLLTLPHTFNSGSVRAQADEIFADVVEEFCDLGLITGHYETWKRKFAQSYVDAYVSLSLRKIVKPLVALQVGFEGRGGLTEIL